MAPTQPVAQVLIQSISHRKDQKRTLLCIYSNKMYGSASNVWTGNLSNGAVCDLICLMSMPAGFNIRRWRAVRKVFLLSSEVHHSFIVFTILTNSVWCSVVYYKAITLFPYNTNTYL